MAKQFETEVWLPFWTRPRKCYVMADTAEQAEKKIESFVVAEMSKCEVRFTPWGEIIV